MYHVVRWMIGLALGFYFRRIERFHAGNIPASGPVLFVSNHPNSLTDSFVIGSSVPRKVNFVATVQMFRFAPLKWILGHCGVIPINRAKDDPRAMRTVADTFEACYRVMERGEAVGIFPEGVTYDDSELKEVKSGAARMALELEQRHAGKLGLKIVPAGLSYSAKELYRSDVLVNFGEPIAVSQFLEGYVEHRKDCIRVMTAEIERCIQALIVHTPTLEEARVVAGVKRLYLDRLRLGPKIVHEPISPRAEELLITQRIVAAVERTYREQPEWAAAFAVKLDHYEGWLRRLNVSDDQLAHFPDKSRLVGQSFLWGLAAILGAPIALYGWLHRAIPYQIVKWAVGRFTEPGKKKAQASTVAIFAGIVAFGLGYSIYVLIFLQFFSPGAAFWYALSLPVTGLVAHYYLRELRKLVASVRNTVILLRAPMASRRLLAMRAGLIAEIEAVRASA